MWKKELIGLEKLKFATEKRINTKRFLEINPSPKGQKVVSIWKENAIYKTNNGNPKQFGYWIYISSSQSKLAEVGVYTSATNQDGRYHKS